jgi:formiminotetrahydrofolate cyclodeaminase
MDSNREIIAKLKELNEKLAQLIISTKETYKILGEAIKKSKMKNEDKPSETSLLAKSANKWLN